MLKSFGISNFKAFAENQRVPLRPITLIYGANSSGKSSIIHNTLLIKHALDEGNLDVYGTSLGGDSVDLGGFKQYVHKRDTTQWVEWEAEIDTNQFQGRLAELFASINTVTVKNRFGITSNDMPSVLSYAIDADGSNLLRMSRRKDNNLYLDQLDHEHKMFREVIKAIVEFSTTTESMSVSDYDGLSDAINEIVPSIFVKTDHFLPKGLIKSEAFSENIQATLFPISKGRRKEDLSAAVSFFLPRTLNDIISELTKVIVKEYDRLKYLGPLRSFPPRHIAFSQNQDKNWYAGGGYAWDIVRHDEKVRSLVNKWLIDTNRLQTPYELVIRDFFGVDQLDDPLFHALENIELDILPDYDGDSPSPSGAYPAIKDIEKEIENIRGIIRSYDTEKINELILVDRRSNTQVSHRDVGIGISQILPVLVYAYAYENQMIAIEQPEIHLHPALQADLGDVFIRSALGDSKNNFIIETHSEHLLLRIMKRLRETFQNKIEKSMIPITPDDVLVLFVEPDGTKSIIREMPLNEKGELVKAWPGGFFEEGLKEVF